jgi:hypothetical protein
MKTKLFFIIPLVLLYVNAFAIAIPEGDPNDIVRQMSADIRSVNMVHAEKLLQLQALINDIQLRLLTANSVDCQIKLLIEKDLLKAQASKVKAENLNDISKIRYLKGLQIIKILYEKVLSLDHHFASVRTLSEINKLSNPNQYPEYGKLKEILAAKRDKKLAVDLTAVLGSNTIVSVVQSLTTMINASLSKEEKEKELENVECILDFTLRMQNDLNTIYFETAFLQTSNDKMKEEIELLFRDYTKPIEYGSTLEICRTTDDWERITKNINEYLAKVKAATGTIQYKMQVNLEFSIDRLLQYIILYNSFIDQGGKFYEKFKIILDSYENAKQCETKLPVEYQKLKADIDIAIQKFTVAYKPVEVNGTKMKEILYGLNEFE